MSARLYLAAAMESAIAAGALCVGLPSLCFLAPAVALAMLIPALRARFFAARCATISFVPDPLVPQFSELAAVLAKCAEKAAAGEGGSTVRLVPLYDKRGFVPYEITVSPGKGAFVVTCGEKASRRATDAPLRPRCQLPLRVALQPLSVEVVGEAGAAVLRTPQPLVRFRPKRPRHIGAAGLAYRFYVVALLGWCLASGKTLATDGATILAFVALPALVVRIAAFRMRVIAFLRSQLWFAWRLARRFAVRIPR